MMMALAASGDLPCVMLPGGVTLLAEGGEDAGSAQTIGARFSHGEITLRAGGGHRLPRMRLARRWLSVPGHRGHCAGDR